MGKLESPSKVPTVGHDIGNYRQSFENFPPNKCTYNTLISYLLLGLFMEMRRKIYRQFIGNISAILRCR